MVILEAQKLIKYFGDRLIISVEDLKIKKGDKIGIVGQNGAGKTTLLNILAGEISADEGFVKRYCDIAYIKQLANEDINADAKVLKEFGIRNKTMHSELSGGEHTRIKIANALSRNGSMLFADEPTANLDCNGIEKLEQKLSQIETLIIISHDRDLLNRLCNKIIEVKDGTLLFYEGNYSFYQEQKRVENQRKLSEYEQYIKGKEKLKNALSDRLSKSKSMRKAPRRMGNSEARLHKGKTNEKRKKLDSAANSIKTRLEKLEVKQRPGDVPTIKLDFSLTDPPQNKTIISSEDLSFSYGNNRIFHDTSIKVYNGLKTAIIGDNGAGKTTLLNLINEKNKQIHIAPQAVLGYFYQGFENLDYSKTVLENVMQDSIQTETIVRTILARLIISGDNVHKRVRVLSGGEKIKASLAKLIVSNANVLLLDEPTNYLDMPSIEALENTLSDYEGTVLFTSHDKAFVNNVANRLLLIQNHRIIEFEGNLQALEDNQTSSNNNDNMEIQKSILQMRITEIISKMSLPNSNKEALEAEYQSVIAQYRKIETG
jgi:macrolide transport system ATP-binding/permease protein